MYLAVVLLTMLVLPLGSIAAEHWVHPALPLLALAGRWFVFWGVGARLALAGTRQLLQPSFTARQIFGATGDEVLVLIQELGVANVAAAIVALASLAVPTFVLPSALYATVFYGVAGVRHVAVRHRSANENIAMVSDLLIAVVLGVFVVDAVAG